MKDPQLADKIEPPAKLAPSDIGSYERCGDRARAARYWRRHRLGLLTAFGPRRTPQHPQHPRLSARPAAAATAVTAMP